ncbi:MAG: hypothetical protein RLZ97_1572 [Verrucomicrobiota bacterium]
MKWRKLRGGWPGGFSGGKTQGAPDWQMPGGGGEYDDSVA